MSEKAISQLTNFHTSKVGIKKFVDQVVNEVREGYYNPLELKIYLKAIQKSLEEIDNQIGDLSLTEAEKHNQKSFDLNGANIAITEVGTKYQYDSCGDTVWNYLDEQIKKLSEEKKKREEFLKTISKPMTIADEASGGEMIDLKPAIKTSKTGLKITIK